MTFATPWVLALAPIVLLLAWGTAKWGRRSVAHRQHRWAVAARMLGLALLVVALAQPALVRPVDDRAVLFLLDRSQSISGSAAAEQERLVDEALSAANPEDRSGVAVFGADLRMDAALTPGRDQVRVRSVVEGSATDISGALRAAASLLPTEGSRRVVLLSDLAETRGDARLAARELGEAGIAVDVVQLEGGRGPDAIVESVRAPAVVRRGERVPVEVTIRSNVAGEATLDVAAGDRSLSLPLVLTEGRVSVPLQLDAGDESFLPIEVTLDLPGDTTPENDRGEAVARVIGPARVAVVEGVPGEGEQLAAALEAGGMEAVRTSSVPGEEELLTFDAVVLVNVPRPSVEDSAALASFVEDLGRGLVVVGGDQAFGLGDYHLTPLEAVLPVSSNPDDLVRRQPVAEVLVIDTSGSMAACHCNSGEMAEGGVNKTDISRAGAALAIEALSASDRVGVLAFASASEWVIPLGPRPSPGDVEEALEALTPEGDTEIAQALEQALDELAGAPEQLKHIVLFTDGWDPNDANLLPIARRIADEGVTLSVLGTGEGPGVTLQRMAELGGGRYYPGSDLMSIPEVFVEETLTVARNLATEGAFLPALGSPSPVTRELASSPPLLGYVLTKAKSTASLPLEVGPGDPLLATWQRGLGRVSAWTSDATSRWASGWVTWEGFADFWGRLVRDVLPPGRESPPEVWVEAGTLRVRMSGGDAEGAIARVRAPSGEVEIITLDRTGVDTFEGRAGAAAPGAYWVAVTVEDGAGGSFTSGSGAVAGYPEEFAFRSPDPGLAEEVAAATGGRVDPEPATWFDPAPSRGAAERPIWTWLVAAALALFLADVALRRLDLAPGDAAAWREGLRSERTRERRRVEEVVARREAGEEVDVASDSETLQRLMRRKRR